MNLECPHCYLRVGVGKDGICPSCQANVHDQSGIDATMSTLIVEARSDFPQQCCLCGSSTTRNQKISHDASTTVDASGDGDDYGGFFGGLLLLLSVLLPFGKLLRLISYENGNGTTTSWQRMQWLIPQCEFCKDKKIVSFLTNSERQKLKVVVNNDFKAEFERLNSPG